MNLRGKLESVYILSLRKVVVLCSLYSKNLSSNYVLDIISVFTRCLFCT